MTDPLALFTPPTREWFASVFKAPTAVQAAAWEAIADGRHALVVAPTGSGKTLAAFLWALDRLSEARDKERRGVRVLYISPLKALGVDVERNLRAPLTGIKLAAERLGLAVPDIRVGVRSGDTAQKERAALVRRPPDVLITTPESLYLMLTSSASRILEDVETVIVDEIHAVAGSKRGTHLALSLERLDLLTGHDVQRVALSATVRPIERVAAFLGGDRDVQVVAPPTEKLWDVSVRLPVVDLTNPGPALDAPVDPLLAGPGTDTATVDGGPGNSIWPHVERAVYDTVVAGRSTLVFTNGRRTAERLTGRLNEIWAEEHDPDSLPALPARPPAQVMEPSAMVRGAPLVIARAHHGSVSKEQRAEIESALKSGELRCVVATSSLELGIDMGAVDRVIQIGAAPSVASALQRVGRAGHVVGAVSAGDVYPLHRGDLAAAVVTTERMLSGQIEELKVPRQPLDVLTQQTLAAVAAAGDAGLDGDEWYAAVRRSHPYQALQRPLLDATVELLSGAYPSADFATLRARVVVGDDGRLYPRPGALRLAATSGGTIPDRGLFGVFLAGDEQGPRRVGELDEEMVHESRVGDVFALGASSWRIEEITRDRVLVSPAPGNTGRLPFWKGEDDGRPAELGRHIGQLQREAGRDAARLEREFVDEHTRANLTTYLDDQRIATGTIPDDRTVVLERFRDELGDWRVVVHSPLGKRVLGAWSLIMAEALSRETGVDVTPVAADDGVVLRLPDSDLVENLASLIIPEPDEVERIVTEQVGSTALFAGRFRECAGRALLLPRLNPGRRAPLWQQRQRAAQLLEVARHHPRFPIVLETVREVTQDVYDVPGLIELVRQLRAGTVRLVEVVTEAPSPFAASLLFRYPGAFMYDGDVPLAERRAAMLSLDPQLLAAALGTLDLREVLDGEVLDEVVAELQHTAPARRATDAESLADLPRLLGPIRLTDLPDRTTVDIDEALATLGRRVAVVTLAGSARLVAASDLAILRDALGLPVPAGYAAQSEPGGRDALTQLIARFARVHGPFTAQEVAAEFGLGTATVSLVLDREVAGRRLIAGRFSPDASEGEFVDPEVLRRLRSRSLARARAQLQPVSGSAYARFLLDSHQLSDPPKSSPDEVLQALQRLAGAALPASAWETHVLPGRVAGYRQQHLDELLAEGEVVIRVRGSAGPHDPVIALVPAADLDLLPPLPPPDEEAALVAEAVGSSEGTWRSFADRIDGAASTERVETLWRAAEQGAIAPASMSAVRARIGGTTRAAHKASRPSPRRRARLPRLGRPLGAPAVDAPVEASGRWYRVGAEQRGDAEQAVALASSWLERFGVITRGGVTADGTPGGFAAAYRLLAELESAGKVLRGYLIQGLGGAQFSTTDVIEELRRHGDSPDVGQWPSGARHPAPVVMAALDPANPYGSSLPWPDHPDARPARTAGSLVVLADGVCIAYLTRGGRRLTLFGQGPERTDHVALVVAALRGTVTSGRMSRVRIEEIDGERIGASGMEQAMLAAGARLTPKGIAIEADGA